MMGAEEKCQVDNHEVDQNDWRKVVSVCVVHMLSAIVIFKLGEILRIWKILFPGIIAFQLVAGLLISGGIGLGLMVLYLNLVLPLFLKLEADGSKYFQSGDYDKALESYQQFYDQYSQHPLREKLVRLVTLSVEKYTYPERALINQAYVHFQLGNTAEVIRCYEQSLELNPANRTAISSLNIIAALTGGEVRPVPGGLLPFRKYARGKRSDARWQGRLMSLISLFFTACGGILCFNTLGLSSVEWTFGSLLALIASAGVAAAATFSGLLNLIRWAVARELLWYFQRGERLYSQQRYDEGIQAYQKQVTFLKEKPWIDKWRWLILPKSGPYSYQEWALIQIADGYVLLGEGDRLLPLFEEVIALNPRNGLAVKVIKFINLFRTEKGAA